MKQFILENWRLIVEVVLLVGSTVLFILRKKPVKVIDTLKETIVRLLPGLINLAETKVEYSGNGSAKLMFVLEQLQKVLRELGYGDDIVA